MPKWLSEDKLDCVFIKVEPKVPTNNSKMASQQDPRIKNIKIKTGVLKRVTKEKTMYEKEAVDQEAKVERMKQEGKDEYDIKKQIEVLEESKMMIPDCKRRIRAAYTDLKNLIDQEEELKEAEEYQTASALLEEHAAVADQ